MALYNTIGVGYNNTRNADPYILSRIITLLQPVKDGRYLDLGCGTGNYSIPIAEQGYSFCGIDPSTEMLERAKATTALIDWKYGVAENIPAADNSFDGAICTLTIHHWTDINTGFKELYRVLKPGARVVIFTATPEQMDGYWLCHYFPAMMKLSAEQMPDMHEMQKAADNARLEIEITENYFVPADLQDRFLYVGKYDAEMYFDEELRKGISSFAKFSAPQEVTAGLAKLRTDIDSGALEQVRTSYENNIGDYLFLILKKP